MSKIQLTVLSCYAFCVSVVAGAEGGDYTKLFLAGYSVIPEPRSVDLTGRSVDLTSEWVLQFDGVDGEDIAIKTLLNDMEQLNGLRIRVGQSSSRVIYLSTQPGTVRTSEDPGIDRQAYEAVEQTIVDHKKENRSVFLGIGLPPRKQDGNDKDQHGDDDSQQIGYLAGYLRNPGRERHIIGHIQYLKGQIFPVPEACQSQHESHDRSQSIDGLILFSNQGCQANRPQGDHQPNQCDRKQQHAR